MDGTISINREIVFAALRRDRARLEELTQTSNSTEDQIKAVAVAFFSEMLPTYLKSDDEARLVWTAHNGMEELEGWLAEEPSTRS